MTYSLFLYASNTHELTITRIGLQKFLCQLEFSDQQDNTLLLPGKKLMDFITFLGCSPSLKLGEIESAIKLHLFDQTTAMGGESVETVRYPGCKHPLQDPLKLLHQVINKESWQCPTCGQEGNMSNINWRKTAGFSTTFIEISQIFPKEAIPSDKLLDALFLFTGVHWQWFYSKTTF